MSSDPPSFPERFLVGPSLGRLGRRLRMLGVDAAYPGQSRGPALLALCLFEGRFLLTRDQGLAKRLPGRSHLVRGDTLEEQWRGVVPLLRPLLSSLRPLSRCLACNRPLLPASPAEARPLVPPRVAATCDHFLRCPGCGRFYWHGTHARAMGETTRRLMVDVANSEEGG